MQLILVLKAKFLIRKHNQERLMQIFLLMTEILEDSLAGAKSTKSSMKK